MKHPGTSNPTSALSKPTSHSIEDPLSHNVDSSESGKPRRPSSARSDASTAEVLLRAKGFIPVKWYGKYEADKVAMGTFAITTGQGGMYGLVFDNTFSKATSKTATFVLLTYPTNAPPHPTHHLHSSQQTGGAMAIAIGSGTKSQSPRIGATASDSVDSLQSHLAGGIPSSRGTSVHGRGTSEGSSSAPYYVGVLMKRRRKKGQGWARRYFSLDYATCTLSYYHDRNTSALRGAIPLSLAAISAVERRREITIDSGAELWHLKAINAKDFDDWTKALEAASRAALAAGIDENTSAAPGVRVSMSGFRRSIAPLNDEEEREWAQVEALVSRIVGTRDAIRRLANDTKTSHRQNWMSGLGISSSSPGTPEEGGDYFGAPEKKSFWKRKVSSPMPRPIERTPSSQLGIPTVPSNVTANGSMGPPPPKPRNVPKQEQNMHDHCEDLLRDLDSVLLDFSTLMASSRRRRTPVPKSAVSRRSFESTSTGEFYDAEGGDENESQVVVIEARSDDETEESDVFEDFASDDATSISSTAEDRASTGEMFCIPKPKSLTPLPITKLVKRRSTVPEASVSPPSLISFLRKNVGKDLSAVSMPVSANEPASLLQRLGEYMEYTNLLDLACQHTDPASRLLYVAAYAISSFSVNRSRERANRKPFNPMLGETFELVRGEGETPGNFRFIAEKVSHRPVIMACQADSPNWTFAHSAAPLQKFWGKSAELITEGKIYVILRLKDGVDECYSWNVATVFLRNVVVGEKYMEPVGTTFVNCESTSFRASVEFKSKGMFGGRSEDVVVETFDKDNNKTNLGLIGTWTTSLRLTDHGKTGPEVWRTGKLIVGSETRYGFTDFAATLNEISESEEGKLAITDTRFRRDQRAVEDGDLDTAEEWKAKLEDAQRNRRKEMEARGTDWKSRWFVKAESAEEQGLGLEWRLKTGREGYWEERAKGTWTGVEDVLCVGAVEG